ncbi:MAG: ribonuclease III [Reichenbachiella sp.]|uniref:ribonuclease III n=1 Tax=Reichenbachiella sp. TaxID=2184521 RepID=UPI002966DB23|nr:ribonuclease III [Reichenbachiella sp.]MDW3209824.1 ribonuclease III [Reichenbachiella sp.]
MLLFRNAKDRKFAVLLKRIIGFNPSNLKLYALAMRHSSAAQESRKGFLESNERLEYLGDAVLGMAVAEYLFNKYPFKDEGFLTEVRSRMVNREHLNQLARKIGLADVIKYNGQLKANGQSFKSIYGDALEALVGAVYLDKGFAATKAFIFKMLIIPHIDLDEIINNNTNFKSKIIEWSQKENKDLRFEVEEQDNQKHFKKFEAKVYVGKKEISVGHGLSKKKAEQNAAEKSCQVLKIE